jgi:hypothetical protein
MKTVAALVMARRASRWIEVLGGRTPLARRWVRVRGRRRSYRSILVGVEVREGGKWRLGGRERGQTSTLTPSDCSFCLDVEGVELLIMLSLRVSSPAGAAVELLDFLGGITMRCMV